MVRVANRSALTSEMVAGSSGSLRFMSQGISTDDGGANPDGGPISPVDANGRTPGEPDARIS